MSQPPTSIQSDHPDSTRPLTRTRSTQSISVPVACSPPATPPAFAPQAQLIHHPASRFASPQFAHAHPATFARSAPHAHPVYVAGVLHDQQQPHLPPHHLHYHPQPLPPQTPPIASRPHHHHYYPPRTTAPQSPPSTSLNPGAPAHHMHYAGQSSGAPAHVAMLSARHAPPPSPMHPVAYQYYTVPPPQPYPMYYPYPYRMPPSAPFTPQPPPAYAPQVAPAPARGAVDAPASVAAQPPEHGPPPWRGLSGAACERNLQGGAPSAPRAIAKHATARRRRLKWTDELHQKFLRAIDEVGSETAVPKALMMSMNVPGLTRENIASHLQKYRQRLKERAAGAAADGERNGSEHTSSDQAANESARRDRERVSSKGAASSGAGRNAPDAHGSRGAG